MGVEAKLSLNPRTDKSERKLIKLNNKAQAQSVYSIEGLSCTLSANGGGQGGKTGLYLLPNHKKKRELIVDKVKMPVLKRKYSVDIVGLQELLREGKKATGLTNNDIAARLGLPLSHVAHWFRTDKYFSIPSRDVWFDLKKVLNISVDSFDESIMEFVEVDGEYDMNNRIYSDEGLSPTLKCQNDGELIKEHNKKGRTIKVIGNVSPSNHWRDNVHDVNGISPALTSCDYKSPRKILVETQKGEKYGERQPKS